MEVGPVSDGMAITAVSWSEVKAWMQITGTRITPWAARTIREMSTAYANEHREASDNTSRPAPYGGPMTDERRQAVADKISQFMARRING